MGNVFFSRCLPEKLNAVKVAIEYRQLFIGWPAVHGKPQAGRLRSCIYDIAAPDWEEKIKLVPGDSRRTQYKRNCHFSAQVTVGDVALIPSAQEGLIYAGRVISRFRLHGDPEWSQAYLRHIQAQGADVSEPAERLVQVAQSCEVDRFRPIPYSSVPAWIRRSLFGRSTYGWVGGIPGSAAFEFLDPFIDNPKVVDPSWTDDLREIERRLVDGVGTSSLEHLSVALLQLEHPDQRWQHVGGSGDGGIDGVGTDGNGAIVGLLQCKYLCSKKDLRSAFALTSNVERKVLTTLSDHDLVRTGIEIWNRSKMAQVVLSHAQNLPLAVSLRVGRSALAVPPPQVPDELRNSGL